MKKLLLLFTMAIVAAVGLNAQIITSDPGVITQSSKNFTLYYHPNDANSNKGLANLPQSTKVYAHIGLITDKSNGGGDWKYAPSWGDNSAKYELKYVSANLYSLTISSFSEYFGLAAGENVKQIAMVFRTADASKEGKTASGGDIYYDVLADGFNMSFSSSITGIAKVNDKAALTIATTQAATITLSVNGTKVAEQANASKLTYDYTFTTTDTYKFTATAKNAAGETLTKDITISVPKASQAATYPGGTPKMGAVANADGSVTFCLAAPNKQSVILVPSWDDYAVLNSNVMNYQDYNGYRYFWITIKGLNPDTPYPYYYIVDGTIKVSDPYAHLVLDPYSDKWLDKSIWPDMPAYPYDKFDNIVLAVYHGNQDNYKFSNFEIPDHRNLVIYEMLFRDFTGTVGKAEGNGTVRQAIEKIPYLASLGINAVELMPIMEFNGNNSWGYNTNFYLAPDKAYGSPDDYKEFIELCHQNGIAVILDIVFNQSDGLHPWYQMYNIDNNPFYNKNAPHDYSVLNDWKQDCPLVQQQWDDALRYWMTAYNVDGFRFDLVKGLGDNASYSKGTEAYNQSRIDRMTRLHSVIKSVKPNGIHINEHLASAAEETPMGNDGQLQWANFSHNAYQFAMGFNEDNQGGRINQMFQNYGRPEYSYIAYAESHDEERAGYKINSYGVTAAKSRANRCKRLGALAAQLLLTPGPKMIWQFGELAADETTKSSNGSNNTSPKKVIWDRIDPAYSGYADYNGLLEVYQALGWLRRANPDLFLNGYTYVMSDNVNTPRTIKLSNGNKEVIAFINGATSGNAVTVSAAASKLSASNSQLICASAGTTPTLNGSNNVSVSLAPHSMAVFATKDVNGIEEITPDADSHAAAYGGDGEIIVVGEYTNAQAYTLDGRATGLTNLEKGIYIVIVDGTSAKVAVK